MPILGFRNNPLSILQLLNRRMKSRRRSTKEEAMDIVSRLPDDVSWQDIVYRLYVRKKIEEGIEAAEAGRFVSQAEVKRLFAR